MCSYLYISLVPTLSLLHEENVCHYKKRRDVLQCGLNELDTCLARLLLIIYWQLAFIRVCRPLILSAGLSLTWHTPGPTAVAHPNKKLRNTGRSAISWSQTNIAIACRDPYPLKVIYRRRIFGEKVPLK